MLYKCFKALILEFQGYHAELAWENCSGLGFLPSLEDQPSFIP